MPFFPDTPGEAGKIVAGAQTANDLLRTVLAAPQIRANTAGIQGQNVEQGVKIGDLAYAQPRQAAGQMLLGYVADEKDIPSVMQQYMPEAEELVHNLGNILRTDTDKYTASGRPQLVPLSAQSRDNIRATVNTLIGPARERQKQVVEGWIASQGNALDPAAAQGLRQYVMTSGKFYAPETFQKIAQQFTQARAENVQRGTIEQTAGELRRQPGLQNAAFEAQAKAEAVRLQEAEARLGLIPGQKVLQDLSIDHQKTANQLGNLQYLEQRQSMGLEPITPGSTLDLRRKEHAANIATSQARLNEINFDIRQKTEQMERSKTAASALAKLSTVPIEDIATRQKLMGDIYSNLSGDQVPQALMMDIRRLEQSINNFQELQKSLGTLEATLLENKGGRGYELVSPMAKELSQNYLLTAQQAGQKQTNFVFAYPGTAMFGEDSKPKLRTFRLPIADAIKMQTVETSMYANPTDLAWFMRRVYAPYLPDMGRAMGVLDSQYPNIPQGVKERAVEILQRAIGVGGQPVPAPAVPQTGPQVRTDKNAALGINPAEPVTNLIEVGSQPSGPLTAPQIKQREKLRGY